MTRHDRPKELTELGGGRQRGMASHRRLLGEGKCGELPARRSAGGSTRWLPYTAEALLRPVELRFLEGNDLRHGAGSLR